MHKQGKEVEAVAVSPDGSLLVSGGRDGLIVLMTLMVPSIIPRSDSHNMHLTSSVLRKSRVIRERSYIHDATLDEDLPLDLLQEEEDEDAMMESWLEVEEMANQFAYEPESTKNTTSFSRMKRRSRFDEKATELPDYATVRKKKGTSAKNAREKRTKGKSYDIPTMVAHLSAAVRVYGPEEPNSSSESEEEQEHRRPPTRAAVEDPKVDILTHIKAWSNPENISLPAPPRRKISVLPEIMGKAKTNKEFFEASDSLTKNAVEEQQEEEENEEEEEEGKAGNDQPQVELEVNYSPDGDLTPPVVPNMYELGNSFRLEDLMAVNSDENLVQWTTPPHKTTETSAGQTNYIPTLSTQQELEEEPYSDDDVVSMI